MRFHIIFNHQKKIKFDFKIFNFYTNILISKKIFYIFYLKANNNNQSAKVIRQRKKKLIKIKLSKRLILKHLLNLPN